MVSSIDISGSISIWSLTLLSKTHHINPPVNREEDMPYDISWWSNDKLVVITKAGALTVLSLAFENRSVEGREGHTNIADYTSILSTIHQFSVSIMIDIISIILNDV